VNPSIRQEIYAWRTPRDPAAQEIEPQGLHIRGRTALAEKVLANEEQRRRKLDLTGHIYGRLTVLYRVKIGGNTWMCRCECREAQRSRYVGVARPSLEELRMSAA
jgi:hypothetical protein